MSYWDGKVALITGGSAGFGLELASAFAASGARVGIAARNPQQLERAVERLQAAGTEAAGFPADITDPRQVEQLVTAAMDRFGRIDVLVNNAGRSDRGAALETSPERFRELLELNFLGLVRCTQAAAPHLIASRGHLVNIGSLAAKTASKHLGAYPASKFPVAAYSQQLRYELGPQGVHVLLVCPGPIARTDAGTRYDAQADGLPAAARQPGGGVKLSGIPPQRLAHQVLRACERRRPELVVPGKAKLLLAVSALWPSLGDWIVNRMTGGQEISNKQ